MCLVFLISYMVEPSLSLCSLPHAATLATTDRNGPFFEREQRPITKSPATKSLENENLLRDRKLHRLICFELQLGRRVLTMCLWSWPVDVSPNTTGMLT